MRTEDTQKPSLAEGQDAQRLLVFMVDDGCFGIHLDWTEAVYRRDSVAIHAVRTRSGGAHTFISHRGEPAFIVDLRRLFGLHDVLGEVARSAFVVVRSGSYRLALSIDELVGVEPIDLTSQAPVASALERDGGLCVGHLVRRDDGVLVVLDPNRLLDGAMRDALDPIVRAARASIERQHRIDELWENIRKTPTPADLRNYARLCRRGGRSRAANATRLVLKCMEPVMAGEVQPEGEKLMRELITLAAGERSGEVVFDAPEVNAKVVIQRGRVVDAAFDGEWGEPAFRKLLEAGSGSFHFVPGEESDHPARIAESTVALLIASLERISEGRRGRRER